MGRLRLRLAAETRQQAHVAVPLLATDAIADRDQAAHDNPRGDALHDSAEQRLNLVGELEHVADTRPSRHAWSPRSRAAL